MNRLKELRKEKNMTLDDLALKTGVKRGTINNYELEKTEPKASTWQKLADALNVPVDYLMGTSDDRDGWHLWEDATGYSKATIEYAISELINVNKLSSEDDLQKQIALAVTYLDNRGITDKNAVMATRRGLYELLDRIHSDFYIDPNKVEEKKIGGIHVSTNKNYDGSFYYDDMDKDVYNDISEIIQHTLNELAEYLQNHKFDNRYDKRMK